MDEISKLNQRIDELCKEGQYAEAIPLAWRSLKKLEQTLGQDHSEVVNALIGLSDLYKAITDYKSAKEVLEKARIISEGSDPMHPIVGSIFIRLGQIYQTMKDYDQATPLFVSSLRMAEQSLGLEHPNTGIALENLADLYDEKGDYDGAIPFFERALKIAKKNLGKEHFQVSFLLNSLATMHQKTNSFQDAKALFERALKVAKRVDGSDHPNVAAILCNLALIHESLGEYEKAVSLLKLSVKISEKTLGNDHPQVGIYAYNLGTIYAKLGNYQQAKSLIERSIEIRRGVFGEASIYVADSTHTLGLLYWQMGDYMRAKPLLEQSLIITEQTKGDEHQDVVASLHGLGLLFHDMKNYEYAETLYQKSLKMVERLFGKDHQDLSPILNNLAQLNSDRGNYRCAEEFYKRSLNIIKQHLGSEHPDMASPLQNLGSVYHSLREYPEATRFYERSLKIRQRAYGPWHPSTAVVFNNLAFLNIATENLNGALNNFKKGLFLENRYIENVFLATITEKQKLECILSLSKNFDAALSLINRNFIQDRDAVKCGFEWTLTRKGVVLDAVSNAREVIRNRLPRKAKKHLDHLQDLLGNLCNLFLSKAEKQDWDQKEYNNRVLFLQQEIEKAESLLFKESKFAEEELRQKEVTLKNLMRKIPKDSALVEFIKIKEYDLSREGFHKDRYLAFCVSRQKGVTLVDIGLADEIELLIKNFLISIQDHLNQENLVSESPSVVEALKNLYEKIWKPLKKQFGKAKNIFISPDGLLNLLPFAALIDPDGDYLIENYSTTYLTSGKELVSKSETKYPYVSELFLVANPDFGEGKRFRPLKGTEFEKASIPPLVPGYSKHKKIFCQKRATKKAIMKAKVPRIMHLATHGFFLDEHFKNSDDNQTNIETYENPLLRSGLAFAGANRRYTSKKWVDKDDDGHLTALEVTGLDLYGCQLVVLSACVTGFGEIKNGEGVFGLRRAFSLSGANNLMMSLWELSDRDTANQVVSFYKNIKHLSPAKALRKAQLDTIKYLKKKRGFAPVSLWAPFIMQGPQSFKKLVQTES